jgi:hypothetical protein
MAIVVRQTKTLDVAEAWTAGADAAASDTSLDIVVWVSWAQVENSPRYSMT